MDTFDENHKNYVLNHPDPKVNNLWRDWMNNIRLKMVTSIEELEEILHEARMLGRIAWDVETRSLEASLENVVGHCLAVDAHTGYYIPVAHRIPEDAEGDLNLDPDKVWELLIDTFNQVQIYVYNYKFEGRILRSANHPILAFQNGRIHVHDVYAYRWIDCPDDLKLDLKSSSMRYLGIDMLQIKEVPGVMQKVKSKQVMNFGEADPRLATLYAAADPVCTYALWEKLMASEDRRFFPDAHDSLCWVLNLEHRIIDALFEMERPINGNRPSPMDRQFLENARKDLEDWIVLITHRMFELAGREFSPASPAQVASTLVGISNIKLDRSAKGNPVTDEKALMRIASRDTDDEDAKVRTVAKISKYLLLFRSLAKQKSTYVDTLLEGTKDEPFARFNFRSVGARSGRFASGKPEKGDRWYTRFNAQNVPNAGKFRPSPCRLVKNPEALVDIDSTPGLSTYLRKAGISG